MDVKEENTQNVCMEWLAWSNVGHAWCGNQSQETIFFVMMLVWHLGETLMLAARGSKVLDFSGWIFFLYYLYLLD